MKHVYSSHALARALLELPDSDVFIADKYSVGEDNDLYDESIGYAPLAGVEERQHSSFWDDSSFHHVVLVPETRDDGYY